MIKLVNNQRGAALVLVLGIIMLIMIFTTVLAAQMTNTQQQIKITDKTIDARNLARMGLDYAGVLVSEAITTYRVALRKADTDTYSEIKEKDREQAKKTAKKTASDDFINNINLMHENLQLKNLDVNHYYEITPAQIEEKLIDGKVVWEVTIGSKGTAKGKEESQTSKIIIEK